MVKMVFLAVSILMSLLTQTVSHATVTVGRTAAIYGWVADEATNMPISNASVRIHRYDEATGYLLFMDSIYTEQDGSFVFKLNEPIKGTPPQPVPPITTYLLEANRHVDYLLARQKVVSNGVNDEKVMVLLTASPTSIQAGKMIWDKNATTLKWRLRIKNNLPKRQIVEIYGLVGSPAITGSWINFETDHQVRILKPCFEEREEVVLKVSIPQEIPAGFSICVSAYVTKLDDRFTVYNQLSQCMVKPLNIWRPEPPSVILEER